MKSFRFPGVIAKLSVVVNVALTILFARIVSAAVIIAPNSPTSNVGPSAGSTLVGLVDGVGLSSSLPTGSDTGTALGVTQENAGISEAYVTPPAVPDYFANGGIVPVLTFTLGGSFSDIDSILVWNYNQSTGNPGFSQNNSLKSFTLRFYGDASATSLIGTEANLTVDRNRPATGTGSGPQVAQQVFFSGGINYDNVQSITLELTDNYFGTSGGLGGDRVGLSEVRLSQIPEPNSALFVASLLAGGVVLLRCRRLRRGNAVSQGSPQS